jgi:DNA-binding GntR family transcriptional regulator
MNETMAPVVRTRLMDEVARRLREMVVDGQLEPGSRLNERLLCEQLQVSRTPLREAFRVLASEGLLDLLPNRGAVVAPLSLAELDDTIEVLAALEELAGRLAALRVDDETLRRVQATHHEMVAHFLRRDLQAYFQANQAIHFAIVDATGNAVLAREYRMLNARVRRYRYIANLSSERWQESIDEHEAIIRLLTARDGPGLAAQLRTHLTNKLNAVKQRLAIDGSGITTGTN